MSRPLRWGIMGTGNIADQFGEGVRDANRSVITAVGSRKRHHAESFAHKHNVPTAHGSYEELLDEICIEAVYIALPNSLHHEWTLKSLAAGKHVLCEKPLATNIDQVEEMFDAAKKAGLRLVEAFMYRSHPQTHAVLEKVRSGVIGRVHTIQSSFCYRTARTSAESNCRFSTELAGGSLMDIGCYCISFSRLVAGQEPDRMNGTVHLHESGVDDIAAATLGFPGGMIASFICGMTVQADNTAYVCGDRGYITIPVPWKPPVQRARFSIVQSTPPRMDVGNTSSENKCETIYVDADRSIYALEADDFADLVRGSSMPSVTRQDSLGNMRVLDELRRQFRLAY